MHKISAYFLPLLSFFFLGSLVFSVPQTLASDNCSTGFIHSNGGYCYKLVEKKMSGDNDNSIIPTRI